MMPHGQFAILVAFGHLFKTVMQLWTHVFCEDVVFEVVLRNLIIILYLVVDEALRVVHGLAAEGAPHLCVVGAGDAGEHGVPAADHRLPLVPLIVRVIITLHLHQYCIQTI